MSTLKINRLEPLSGNTITAIGLTVDSASFASTASYVSGSIVNYPDTDSTTPTIMRMVTMTSASFAALDPKDPNTFYVIM